MSILQNYHISQKRFLCLPEVVFQAIHKINILALTWPPGLLEATLVNTCVYTSRAVAHFHRKLS